MNTAFATGPGLFAAATSNKARHLPPDTLRVFCARIEAYDLPLSNHDESLDTSFEILFAKAEGNGDLADALIELGKAIQGNMELLQRHSRRNGE